MQHSPDYLTMQSPVTDIFALLFVAPLCFDSTGFLSQVLQEPGVPSKQLRSRAKAVKKLGSIFSQANRPRSRPVTNIMEEFSEVLQVSVQQ